MDCPLSAQPAREPQRRSPAERVPAHAVLDMVIAPEDPRADDVRALLERHLALMHEVTPVGHVHALDAERLADPALSFFGARRGGVLLGIGALKRLDDAHVELKSMHTAFEARRRGVGAAMVTHLVGVARASGYRRVSLETGSFDAFAPARALYAGFGFVRCAPFGGYTDNPHSVCLTLELDGIAEPQG